MIESSVAYPTRTNTESPFVDHIEREIARLKAARPNLATRIERAEHILVTHLSTANGTHKPIKVRVRADGSRSFVVRSGAKLRKVYTVKGSGFTCDCPDSRRRHSACKHGIACWLLERAARRPSSFAIAAPKTGACSACSERVPRRELTEVQDYHESLSYFEGDRLCPECFSASDCW